MDLTAAKALSDLIINAGGPGSGRHPDSDATKAKAATEKARNVFKQHLDKGTLNTKQAQVEIRNAHTHAYDYHNAAGNKSQASFHKAMADHAEKNQIRLGGKPHFT